ncbi:metallophosphoesterase [Candidatus Omnitrophota bacterium]
MRADELISALIFIFFWVVIYAIEIGYVFYFIKRKVIAHSWFANVVHIIAVTGILCFAYSYFIEPYWIETKHIEIRTDKLKESELTIVQISDLHCDEKIRNETKLPLIINALTPDIIVFTGDALNTPRSLQAFRETLSSLKARIGKYAVKGNFDVWYWNALDLFEHTGFSELDGQSMTLSKDGETFSISGLDVGYSANLSFLDRLRPAVYNILLYHYPGINEEVKDVPVDLFLSGHTHGGQVAIPFYGALVTLSKYGKKYESGRYDVDGKVVYVNRGIGMEGGCVPRIRFWARPEITVFHIRPKEK